MPYALRSGGNVSGGEAVEAQTCTGVSSLALNSDSISRAYGSRVAVRNWRYDSRDDSALSVAQTFRLGIPIADKHVLLNLASGDPA